MPHQQTQGVQIKGRDAEDFATLTTDGAKVRLDVSSGGIVIPTHDEQVIDESGAPATTTITYKLGGATVATKTITVSGTTTTIAMS
jgi:hypothetical protein